MPFTIGGDWIPNKQTSDHSSKPVKVRLVKRGKSILTVILNLQMTSAELSHIASSLKKKLGCGGCVRESTVEIQGDKVEEVKGHLQALGIKSQ